MSKLEVVWLKANCPMCGRTYEYPEESSGYKPKTCGNFECVQKYLHPELHEPYFRNLIEGKDKKGGDRSNNKD